MNLAILGGKPVRTKKFPPYLSTGEAEKAAVMRVMDSGVLSQYLGCWHENFMGGPEVRALEEEWAAHFGVKHAIAVNSCTSGLQAAVGAIGVEPGDEVIVPPLTMSATATAPLVFNAVPVFADVEPDCFCLDPAAIEKNITPQTRAIIAVDLMGLPYDRDPINALAKRHGLYIIEDTAQAPGALHKGRHAGTLGDIGVYSLNYHKHIHCGEGGIVVTDDDLLADRVRLIRNHAESVVEGMGVTNLSNMLGFNFRMTEMQAAITRCQLKKLAQLVRLRQDHCAYLEKRLAGLEALRAPRVREGCTHAYYLHGFRFNAELAGVHRDPFIAAVKAELPATELREKEGVKIGCGYVKPLYLLPMFQRGIVYGSRPGTLNPSAYAKGICPVAERLHESELFTHELMHPQMTEADLDDVVLAFEKVWRHRHELTQHLK